MNLVATVSNPNPVNVTGSVSFYDGPATPLGSNLLGTVQLQPALGHADATLALNNGFLTQGPHFVFAYYSGSNSFWQSNNYILQTVRPIVGGILPASGPIQGGTSVTITGSGFRGSTQVYFGSVAATSFTVNSDTQITAVAPSEGVGTVDVTVGTANGSSATSSSDQFTYVPSVSINSVTQSGGTSGTTQFIFTVTLSAPSSQTITVNFATADGTAVAGNDYYATSGTVTFNPGQTTQTITVTVIGDPMPDPNETFYLNLSNAINAWLANPQGVGTIQ